MQEPRSVQARGTVLMEKGTSVLLSLAAVWIVGTCGYFLYKDAPTKQAIETASDTDKRNNSDTKE